MRSNEASDDHARGRRRCTSVPVPVAITIGPNLGIRGGGRGVEASPAFLL